jgi:hypothetical protein
MNLPRFAVRQLNTSLDMSTLIVTGVADDEDERDVSATRPRLHTPLAIYSSHFILDIFCNKLEEFLHVLVLTVKSRASEFQYL